MNTDMPVNPPRVSVIVPLYNKGPYVLRSLRSIAAQSLRDFEAIIVDDGSRDDGPDTVEQFLREDARFRLIRQANAGPGAARNRGLAHAQASLCAFLDADDEWLPTHLEEGAAVLAAHADVTAVSTSVINLPGAGTNEPLWRARGLPEGLFQVTPSTPAQMLVWAVAYMHPCSTVARTEAVRRHGGFYEKRCLYAEDAHMWLRLLLSEPVWFSLPARVTIWRDAAALSGNLAGMRPVEPFLEYPEDIESHCPEALRPLLASFLAIRAFKTATLLGLHGQWANAARLRKRFRVRGDWRLPFYWAALGVSNPAGASLAGWTRHLRSPR